MKCSIADCREDARKKGMCCTHYERVRKYGDPTFMVQQRYRGALCKVDGCKRAAVNIGLCAMHRLRLHRNNNFDLKIMPRGFSKRFYKRSDGNTTPEHRVLAELALGKPLPKDAVVHHHSTMLVICPDQAYHMFLHKRIRDGEAAGVIETWLQKLTG